MQKNTSQVTESARKFFYKFLNISRNEFARINADVRHWLEQKLQLKHWQQLAEEFSEDKAHGQTKEFSFNDDTAQDNQQGGSLLEQLLKMIEQQFKTSEMAAQAQLTQLLGANKISQNVANSLNNSVKLVHNPQHILPQIQQAHQAVMANQPMPQHKHHHKMHPHFREKVAHHHQQAQHHRHDHQQCRAELARAAAYAEHGAALIDCKEPEIQQLIETGFLADDAERCVTNVTFAYEAEQTLRPKANNSGNRHQSTQAPFAKEPRPQPPTEQNRAHKEAQEPTFHPSP